MECALKVPYKIFYICIMKYSPLNAFIIAATPNTTRKFNFFHDLHWWFVPHANLVCVMCYYLNIEVYAWLEYCTFEKRKEEGKQREGDVLIRYTLNNNHTLFPLAKLASPRWLNLLRKLINVLSHVSSIYDYYKLLPIVLIR